MLETCTSVFLHAKQLSTVVSLSPKLECFDKCQQNFPLSDIMNINSAAVKLLHLNWWTHITSLISRFLQFIMANVPKILVALTHRVTHLPRVVSVPNCIHKQQWLISHPVRDADGESLVVWLWAWNGRTRPAEWSQPTNAPVWGPGRHPACFV